MKVDVHHEIDALTRLVHDGHRDGEPVKAVVATRTFSATPQELWPALTDPEQLRRWMRPVSGELRVGGRYQLDGNAGGTITTCEPARALALTWEYGSDVSWLEVRLNPEPAGGTRLELTHTSTPGDHWEQFGPGATGVGWEMTLLGLAQYLRAGETVDPMAWPASDEGKAFIRSSSDGWRAADVASGADPTHAREAAARTAAFYTGDAG